MNDPFATTCRACGARNAFGPSVYAEEPVAPPPTKRSAMSASAVARWALAIGVVLFVARTAFHLYARSQTRRPIVMPVTLTAPTAPAATKLSPALAAKLPPARTFALTSDGRAVAFDHSHLKVYTSAGGVSEVADGTGPLAPRSTSPVAVVGDAAYWIVADSTQIASVRLLDWTPASVLKGAHDIGALGADGTSIWYTATDGKDRKLFRLDTTSSKPRAVAAWPSTRTDEIIAVTDDDVFVVEPAAIVRVAKSNGHAATITKLSDGEEVGAIAPSDDALYFTVGSHDLYRVPLAGGDRAKVMTSAGGIGDVVVQDKDVVVADRPTASAPWQIDTLPNGDVAQITIFASDVGRQPRLRASASHVVWSTNEGISFGD